MELKFYQTIFLLTVYNLVGNDCGYSEKKLIRHLFDQTRTDAHHVNERPVRNETEPLEIKMKVFLIQLIDVDTRNQIIHVGMLLDMIWSDYHIRWDPREYNGIKRVSLPADKVWKPDIILLNNADEKFISTVNTNVALQHTSIITWTPPGIFKATCTMDVSFFPFDKQMCSLIFGSWTYLNSDLDMKLQCPDNYNSTTPRDCEYNGNVDLSNYLADGEFDLIGAPVKRVHYIFNSLGYSNLDIHIVIKRKPLYFIFNLIIPCIIVSAMALLVFLLPPDSGEKISLGVTVLLSMTMFLLLVADKLPQTSLSIPIISTYFICIMTLCSMSIMFTVLVLKCHHGATCGVPVPYYMRTCINTWLARVLFMRIPERSTDKEDILLQENEQYSSTSDGAISELRTIINELLKITKKIKEGDIQNDIAREWQFAARVIDRFCFIVFGLFILIATVTILRSFP